MKWIKCSEQMPIAGDRVLICQLLDDGRKYIEIGSWLNPFGKGITWRDDSCCAQEILPDLWMPLPSAPKENE